MKLLAIKKSILCHFREKLLNVSNWVFQDTDAEDITCGSCLVRNRTTTVIVPYTFKKASLELVLRSGLPQKKNIRNPGQEVCIQPDTRRNQEIVLN